MLIGIDASRATRAERTGTENYSLQLIRSLVQFDRRNRYRLYFNRPPAAGLFPDLHHVEWRVMPFPRLWTHVRLSAEMWVAPPDVLFVPAHVLPLVRPYRTLVTVHDLGYHYFPEAHRRLDRWYLEWSTRYHGRVASHILADSHASREDLTKVYGVNPERVTVVYPGCDSSFRPISDQSVLDAVRARYGLGPNFVLHVGTIQPRKNLDRLLSAFVGLSRSGVGSTRQRVELVLVGKAGWGSAALRQRIASIRLEDQVKWLGYVDPADLPALMNAARVLAMPSLYEGFGLPVVEAMACGTPVVCANTSSLPEVAGDAALLVDPLDVESLAEALERALWDEQLRAGLRDKSLAQAAKFTWAAAAERTLAVLSKLLASSCEFP
jgi:glycosyltransferase involved in cell wall biosynthesis